MALSIRVATPCGVLHKLTLICHRHRRARPEHPFGLKNCSQDANPQDDPYGGEPNRNSDEYVFQPTRSGLSVMGSAFFLRTLPPAHSTCHDSLLFNCGRISN